MKHKHEILRDSPCVEELSCPTPFPRTHTLFSTLNPPPSPSIQVSSLLPPSFPLVNFLTVTPFLWNMTLSWNVNTVAMTVLMMKFMRTIYLIITIVTFVEAPPQSPLPLLTLITATGNHLLSVITLYLSICVPIVSKCEHFILHTQVSTYRQTPCGINYPVCNYLLCNFALVSYSMTVCRIYNWIGMVVNWHKYFFL